MRWLAKVSWLNFYLQDHGVRQDCSEEVKNPSDAVVQEQKETAASIFQEMESEESLVPTSLMSMSKAGHSVQVPATAPEKNKKARARGGNAGSAPLVVASKQRAKTANSLAEAERLLNKAQKQGEDVLNIAAPKLLGKECSEDPTLDVIRSRLTLVSLALNSSTEKDGEIASKRLHALAMEDKYLKDCESTLFAESDAVMTLGSLRGERAVKMDLFLDLTPEHFDYIELNRVGPGQVSQSSVSVSRVCVRKNQEY